MFFVWFPGFTAYLCALALQVRKRKSKSKDGCDQKRRKMEDESKKNEAAEKKKQAAEQKKLEKVQERKEAQEKQKAEKKHEKEKNDNLKKEQRKSNQAWHMLCLSVTKSIVHFVSWSSMLHCQVSANLTFKYDLVTISIAIYGFMI